MDLLTPIRVQGEKPSASPSPSMERRRHRALSALSADGLKLLKERMLWDILEKFTLDDLAVSGLLKCSQQTLQKEVFVSELKPSPSGQMEMQVL